MQISSLENILATRVKNTFPYRVNFRTLVLENRSKMDQWCTENCEKMWSSHYTYAAYWQFEYEKDATMFTLRWGTYNGNEIL